MTKQCLRFSRLWQAVGWLMVAAVVILSLMPKPPLPHSDQLPLDKLGHGFAYACQMWWFRQAFAAHWFWFGFLLILGVSLEFIQGLTIYRAFEFGDMIANCVGVLIGWFIVRTRLGLLVAHLDRRLNGVYRR